MKVICLHDDAFYALVEEVVARVKEQNNIKNDKWVSTTRAMELLNIKSKTTLQKLRDQGMIKFSQPKRKMILYDSDSIIDYLESNIK